MSLDLRALFQDHQTFYEVWPYYVLLDERPEGRSPVRRKVQAGFDVDLYAAGKRQQLELADGNPDVPVLAMALEEAARLIVPAAKERSEIQILPFENSLVLDTHRNLRAEALVRIRITHNRGLDKPEGPAEEEALSEIRKKLENYGVHEGRGGFGP
jgi:hypothetical protein